MSVSVQPVQPKSREFAEFVELPYRLHRGLASWVPSLRQDVVQAFDPAINPFFDHAEVQAYVALRNGEVVGRIAAIHNRAHNDFHQDRVGFFGFFECEDNLEVASALIDAGSKWIAARGLDVIRGPANFSTNDDCGLLIQGFERPPTILMPHNPPYYERLIQDSGFTKAKDLLAYRFDSRMLEYLVAAAEKVERRSDARTRALDLSRFEAEVQRIRDLYNATWERNWGFVPMTEREFEHLARQLRPVVVADIVRFAEVDGVPVGFAVALPDLNQVLARLRGRLGPWGLVKFAWYSRRINAARCLTLGILDGHRSSGLDVLLYRDLIAAGIRRGYRHAEFSWVLEDNLAMRRPLERMGAVADKTYRIYDRPAFAAGAPSSE